MKTLYIFLICLLAQALVQAQLQRPPAMKKTVLNKTVQPGQSGTPPPPGSNVPPPPASTSTSAPATSSAPTLVYSLTSVRVKLSTGRDNKEAMSEVTVTLHPKAKVASLFRQPGSNMRNELAVNTSMEFGLEPAADLGPEAYLLSTMQTNGIELRMVYNPNLIFDAWKVEGVTLILEFRDQFKQLHPTLGTKTIVFSNANGFLDHGHRTLLCTTDGQFVPLMAAFRDKW